MLAFLTRVCIATDVGTSRLDGAVIPLHLGVRPPSYWDDVEARQRKYGDDASPFLRELRRPSVASHEFDWTAFGFDPRWVGDDSAECVVAVEPGTYHDDGADEFGRFIQGAERRGETAVVVTTLSEPPKSVVPGFGFARHDASGALSSWNTYIYGTKLGGGARVQIVPGLRGADRDLALRLVNEDLQWWTLELSGSRLYSPGMGEERIYPAAGVIEPLLESALGETVVGVWLSPDGVERRYVVPADVDWAMVADWLVVQALPELNPAAMRRYRRLEHVPSYLMTADEERAATSLAEFEAETASRRIELERDVATARAAADTMRHDLLYGRGDVLVTAVVAVLRNAGIHVVKLDDALGGTKSADLLCSLGPRRRLVEVKSVGGGASESLYAALLRHLDSWRETPGRQSVEGGVLVLNHEHKKDPAERSRVPYTRREFVMSQREAVVTSLDLFDAWRRADAERVRSLFFGAGAGFAGGSPVEATQAAKRTSEDPVQRRKWWPRRR